MVFIFIVEYEVGLLVKNELKSWSRKKEENIWNGYFRYWELSLIEKYGRIVESY